MKRTGQLQVLNFMILVLVATAGAVGGEACFRAMGDVHSAAAAPARSVSDLQWSAEAGHDEWVGLPQAAAGVPTCEAVVVGDFGALPTDPGSDWSAMTLLPSPHHAWAGLPDGAWSAPSRRVVAATRDGSFRYVW